MSIRLSADRFVARETAISAAINAAISAGFFFAMFGQASEIAVWGPGGLALDVLPQSFAVAFFASLVPSLLAQRAIQRGDVICAARSDAGTGSLLAAAVLTGLLAVLAGGAAWAAALWASGLDTIPAMAALLIKVGYGAVLGAIVTRHGLQRLLGQWGAE